EEYGELTTQRGGGRMTSRYVVASYPVPERMTPGVLPGVGGHQRPGTPGTSARAPRASTPPGTVNEPSANRQKKEDSPPDGGRRRPKGQEKDQRVAQVIRFFDEEHRRVLQYPYPVKGGRDGAAIKAMPPEYTGPLLVLAVRRYFADAWNLRGTVSIPIMLG